MKNVTKIANILLPLSLGVFLVYYAFHQFSEAQLEEMKSYFKQARFQYIGLATFFMILSLLSRAYRWKYALNYLGYQSKFYNNVMAVSISYLLNFTVPRSGEFSRALVLQKYEKVPFDKGFGSIVSERIIDLFCLVFLVFITFLLQYEQLKGFLTEKIPFQSLVLIGITLVACFTVGTYLVFYSKLKFFVFIKQKIIGLIEGALSVFKMPHRTGFFIQTFIIWASYVLTFYYGTLALEATSHISMGVVMATFVVGSLAISFTNGGFGAFPLLISEILVLYHIPATAGTTFGWILWISQTFVFILAGGLSFLLLPILNKSDKL